MLEGPNKDRFVAVKKIDLDKYGEEKLEEIRVIFKFLPGLTHFLLLEKHAPFEHDEPPQPPQLQNLLHPQKRAVGGVRPHGNRLRGGADQVAVRQRTRGYVRCGHNPQGNPEGSRLPAREQADSQVPDI